MVMESEAYIDLHKQSDADEMQHPLADSQPGQGAPSLSDQSSFVSVVLQTAGSMCEHLPGNITGQKQESTLIQETGQ